LRCSLKQRLDIIQLHIHIAGDGPAASCCTSVVAQILQGRANNYRRGWVLGPKLVLYSYFQKAVPKQHSTLDGVGGGEGPTFHSGESLVFRKEIILSSVSVNDALLSAKIFRE
jgi:hypothetical protein